MIWRFPLVVVLLTLAVGKACASGTSSIDPALVLSEEDTTNLGRTQLAGITEAEDEQAVDPTLCFVKLVPNAKRTKADVEALAAAWERDIPEQLPISSYKLLAVDRETVAIQSMSAVEAPQLKDFFLGQPEVHEVQVEREVFRRPGHLPLEAVKAALAKEARKVKRSKFFQFFRKKRPLGAIGAAGGKGRGQPKRGAIGGPRRKQEL